MSTAVYGPKPWLQQHWDERAAANFIFGGTGAGLLLAWAILAPAAPDGRFFVAGGLALIAAGLAAVWLETGRKLRALHVFFNPRTSWMTRESFAALLTFVLGGVALAFPEQRLGEAAALAALAFLWCQGRILRAAKGIPAWRVPAVTALVVLSGLAEGCGLLLALVASVSGVSPRALALLIVLILARELAWRRYRGSLASLAPHAAASALQAPGRRLTQIGTLAPLALALGAFAFPGLAAVCAVVAGLSALAAGWQLKFALLRRAACNQGFALPQLPVRGAR